VSDIRSTIGAARVHAQNSNFEAAERALNAAMGEIAKLGGTHPEYGALMNEWTVARTMVGQAKQRVAAGTQAPATSGGGMTTGQAFDFLFNSPAAAPMRNVVGQTTAGQIATKTAGAAGKLVDTVTRPARNAWSIIDWISEHPVLTAIGVVGSAAAVSYAYGKGRSVF
jgi:hypothetical protein